MKHYHIDQRKARLNRSKSETNRWLNRNKKMHNFIMVFCSSLLLLALFGVMFVMPIIGIFVK